MKNKIKTYAAIVTTSLLAPSAASAAVVTSWESGTEEGWTLGTVWTVPFTVNMDRASDGSFGVSAALPVPDLGGQTDHLIMQGNALSVLGSNSTELSFDVYSEWGIPGTWGIYANDISVVVQGEGVPWTELTKLSGDLTDAAFSTLSYDVSAVAPALDGASWGQVLVRWRIGTWTDNTGVPGGTHTITIDNVDVSSIPEPTNFSLLTLGGLCLLARRRRQ